MTQQTATDSPARVFVYNDEAWDDPGPEYTDDDVRKHLATFYPELANATIERRDLDDGRTEVRFAKRAGTKGAREAAL